MSRRSWLRVAGLAGGLLAAGTACRDEEPASSRNVLLITLDTTRADALGCYGHPIVKTPNLDRLARGGTRFTQCTTVAPITLPAHLSILAGTYPFVHGVRNNGRYVPDEGITTLAEWLQDRGFATGAEVAAFVLDAMWGLDQGFDSYCSAPVEESRQEQWARLTGHQSVPGDDVADRAIAWLHAHGQKRFFLWVHFFDPHQPWRAPKRFADQYRLPYHAEVAFMDEQVGRVLDELRRLKLDDRTLVAVVGDHGEALGQHDELTHIYYVYDSTMSVPLILWAPGMVPAGRVVTEQVRVVDVAPTLLDLLGLPPLPGVQGVSLQPLLADGTPALSLAAYGESWDPYESYGYARLRMLRADGWKYIHAPRPELYDVRRDPGETTNIAGREPERLAAMRERLIAEVTHTLQGAVRPGPTASLDAVSADRLAALGYVGGYAPPPPDDESRLLETFAGADPKDHIQTVNAHLKAQALLSAGQPQEAEAILKEHIAKEPENPALRSLLARLYAETQQYAAAADQYATLLNLQPDNAPEHYRAGRVLGELGRYAESERHLREAVERMPDFADAHARLAFVEARQGRVQEALERYRMAQAMEPGSQAAAMGLHMLLLERGDRAGAIRVLQEALAHSPDDVMLANNAAWQLATSPQADLRDGSEAVRLAEHARALEGETVSPDVLDTLAAAYAEAGRFADAAETARRAVEAAMQAGRDAFVEDVRSRLALYEASKPFREPE